jgi:hypothetical protein
MPFLLLFRAALATFQATTVLLPVVLEMLFIATTIHLSLGTHLENLSIHIEVRVSCKWRLGKNAVTNNPFDHLIHFHLAGHVSHLHQCLQQIFWQWWWCTHLACTYNNSNSHFLLLFRLLSMNCVPSLALCIFLN